MNIAKFLAHLCHDGFAAKAAPTGYKHTWESNQPAAGKFQI